MTFSPGGPSGSPSPSRAHLSPPLILSYEEHAYQSRLSIRAMGLADCIHYAPDWQRRADVLYAVLHEIGDWPDGIGLLPDGRMAVIGHKYISAFEPRTPDILVC